MPTCLATRGALAGEDRQDADPARRNNPGNFATGIDHLALAEYVQGVKPTGAGSFARSYAPYCNLIWCAATPCGIYPPFVMYGVHPMPSRAEIYRANAEVCSHQAGLPRNASEKERWIKLAKQWSTLAELAKHDRTRIGQAKHTHRTASGNLRSRHDGAPKRPGKNAGAQSAPSHTLYEPRASGSSG